jgi:hypothetical protein
LGEGVDALDGLPLDAGYRVGLAQGGARLGGEPGITAGAAVRAAAKYSNRALGVTSGVRETGSSRRS